MRIADTASQPAPAAAPSLRDEPDSARGLAASGPAATSSPRVLTVCLGNVCRSPAAAAMIADAAAAAGIDLDVESAGTSVASEGRRADRRMRRAAARIDVAITSRTRQVRARDLHDFDLVVAMDRRNLATLLALRAEHGGDAEIRLLRSFDPQASTPDVPDPFRAPPSFHESVLACIAGAIAGIVEWVDQYDGKAAATAA